MEQEQFELPWSANQLKKLSKALRDAAPLPSEAPTYDEVMLYYNEVAVAVQTRIAQQDWASLLGDRSPEITSRSKTVDTLVQKLRRDRNTPLPNVQDIAGVRFEAEMSLSEQDAVASAICGMFEQPASLVHDLRNTPHSGYRGVHVWLRLPVRVEIQVRPHLQGRWANMYESAADALGREIRYGASLEDSASQTLVRDAQRLSLEVIPQIERLRDELDGVERTLAESEGLEKNWLVKPGAPRMSRNTELLTKVDALKEEIRGSESVLEAELLRLKAVFDAMKKG